MPGILIEVEPVLIQAGPFVVRWFGLLLVVALVVGLLVTVRGAAAYAIPARVVLDLGSWALLAGLLGARALHVLEHWEYYLTQPRQALDLTAGGLSFWGGLLAALPVVWWLAGQRGVRFGALADAAAPGLALSEAIGRLGSFVNGDGQGLPASLPWATHYRSSEAQTPDFGVPRHPAQLYQALADLLILALLWRLQRAPWPIGSRFWCWLGLYGFSRALIATVRLDPPFLAGLPLGQLLGLTAVALSGFVIIRLAELAAVRNPARTQP